VTDSRIGKRYAAAVFAAAQSAGLVELIESDLVAVAHSINNDPGFSEFLLSPQQGIAEKDGVFTKVFGDRISALTLDLIRLMLQKGRESELPAVAAEFTRLRRESVGIVHAIITSTEALTEAQKTALVARLQSTSGKILEPEFKIDSSLIGGIKVAYGNFILDGTVKGSLSKLREHLRHDLLKQA
jgi:F-type H+-transporting ATPase subunit delta